MFIIFFSMHSVSLCGIFFFLPESPSYRDFVNLLLFLRALRASVRDIFLSHRGTKAQSFLFIIFFSVFSVRDIFSIQQKINDYLQMLLPMYRLVFLLYCKYGSPNVTVRYFSSCFICKCNMIIAQTVNNNNMTLKNMNKMPK